MKPILFCLPLLLTSCGFSYTNRNSGRALALQLGGSNQGMNVTPEGVIIASADYNDSFREAAALGKTWVWVDGLKFVWDKSLSAWRSVANAKTAADAAVARDGIAADAAVRQSEIGAQAASAALP